VYITQYYDEKSCLSQGRSDGGYIGIYTPKSAQVNFLWGKNDIRMAIKQFYTPKKNLPPKTNFWLRPWSVVLLILLFLVNKD